MACWIDMSLHSMMAIKKKWIRSAMHGKIPNRDDYHICFKKGTIFCNGFIFVLSFSFVFQNFTISCNVFIILINFSFFKWFHPHKAALLVQNTLIEVQPKFQANLIEGVKKFKVDTATFYKDFDNEGPLVEGRVEDSSCKILNEDF